MEPAGAEGRWYPPAEAPEPIDQSPHVRIDAGGMPMGNGQAQRGAVAAQRAEQKFSFAEGEPVHLAAATPAPKSGWAVSFAVTDECASVGHGPGEMVSCAHASRAARSGGTSSEARAMAEPDRYSIEIAIPAPDFSPNEAAGERPKGRAKIDDKLPAKAAEKKKIDYQKEWHLCLNAEEQRNRGRVTATDNLLVLLPWQLSAMGRESATPRTDVERYGAVWRAIFAKGPARNISATGLLRKAADFWATRLGLTDEAARARGSPEKAAALEYITSATRAEVTPPPGSAKPAVAFGPYTKDEVDALFGKRQWRPMLRFVIEQGLKPDGSASFRVCDNAKKSRTNEMLGVHETISRVKTRRFRSWWLTCVPSYSGRSESNSCMRRTTSPRRTANCDAHTPNIPWWLSGIRTLMPCASTPCTAITLA